MIFISKCNMSSKCKDKYLYSPFRTHRSVVNKVTVHIKAIFIGFLLYGVRWLTPISFFIDYRKQQIQSTFLMKSY